MNKVIDKSQRMGLVLGGGGARGLAAIGIIETLSAVGWHPSVIAGTSMGAMIGAFMAAGYSPGEIHAMASGTSWLKVVDLSAKGGLIRGDRFLAWLREKLPATFDGLEIPLICTATDIDTGELIYLSDGDLPLAVRASCAFPGAFEPVLHKGRYLVDGGLKSTVPVAVMQEQDVDVVIACDFQPPLDRPVVEEAKSPSDSWIRLWEMLMFRRRTLAADVLLKAVDILQTEVCRRQLLDNPPDILIAPKMPNKNIEDFRLVDKIIAHGAAETNRVLATLGEAEH